MSTRRVWFSQSPISLLVRGALLLIQTPVLGKLIVSRIRETISLPNTGV